MSDDITVNLTYDQLKHFLTEYHKRLHQTESFPPLNPNKAMNVAAKSLGWANSHVMKAKMEEAQARKEGSSAITEDDPPIAVVINEYTSSDDDAELNTDTRFFETWQDAHLYIGEYVENLATRSDRTLDELYELGEGVITFPDPEYAQDEYEFLGMLDAYNDTEALCAFAHKLDFGLTSITVQQAR